MRRVLCLVLVVMLVLCRPGPSRADLGVGEMAFGSASSGNLWFLAFLALLVLGGYVIYEESPEALPKPIRDYYQRTELWGATLRYFFRDRVIPAVQTGTPLTLDSEAVEAIASIGVGTNPGCLGVAATHYSYTAWYYGFKLSAGEYYEAWTSEPVPATYEGYTRWDGVHLYWYHPEALGGYERFEVVGPEGEILNSGNWYAFRSAVGEFVSYWRVPGVRPGEPFRIRIYSASGTVYAGLWGALLVQYTSPQGYMKVVPMPLEFPSTALSVAELEGQAVTFPTTFEALRGPSARAALLGEGEESRGWPLIGPWVDTLSETVAGAFNDVFSQVRGWVSSIADTVGRTWVSVRDMARTIPATLSDVLASIRALPGDVVAAVEAQLVAWFVPTIDVGAMISDLRLQFVSRLPNLGCLRDIWSASPAPIVVHMPTRLGEFEVRLDDWGIGSTTRAISRWLALAWGVGMAVGWGRRLTGSGGGD